MSMIIKFEMHGFETSSDPLSKPSKQQSEYQRPE